MRKRQKKKLQLEIIAFREAAKTLRPHLESCEHALCATNDFLKYVSRQSAPRSHLNSLRTAYKRLRRAFRRGVA